MKYPYGLSLKIFARNLAPLISGYYGGFYKLNFKGYKMTKKLNFLTGLSLGIFGIVAITTRLNILTNIGLFVALISIAISCALIGFIKNNKG